MRRSPHAFLVFPVLVPVAALAVAGCGNDSSVGVTFPQGDGDNVPVMPAARLVTGLQATSGQIHLAVVVAVLVGRVGARRE